MGIGSDGRWGVSHSRLGWSRKRSCVSKNQRSRCSWKRQRGVGRKFATIGDFYAALNDKVVSLGNKAFRGDSERQLIDDRWFPRARMFPIVDVDSAVRALDLIVVEGEGTSTSPEGILA